MSNGCAVAIVPVYDGGDALVEAVDALLRSQPRAPRVQVLVLLAKLVVVGEQRRARVDECVVLAAKGRDHSVGDILSARQRGWGGSFDTRGEGRSENTAHRRQYSREEDGPG